MLTRRTRFRKSNQPYSNMKVGEVVCFSTPFGPNDGWLNQGVKDGYEMVWSKAHLQAIKDAEKKLRAKFSLHYGEGFVRVMRLS